MGWISNRGRWKINILRFWNRLVGMDNDRMLKRVFLWEREQHRVSNKSNFNAQAKQLIIDLGKRDSYNNMELLDLEFVKKTVFDKENIHWANSVLGKPKLDFLSRIKPNHCVEPYIKMNLDRYERSLLSQLRYGILQIELETGCFKQEERVNRLCKICNEGVVEDQCHFVFNCPSYTIRRGIFYDKARERIVNWDSLDDINKFRILFEKHPRMLGKFVKDIFLYRKSLVFK